jgi:hypothetical protein
MQSLKIASLVVAPAAQLRKNNENVIYTTKGLRKLNKFEGIPPENPGYVCDVNIVKI